MAAIIGALRGVLSLDSVAFETGAKRSMATMGDMERRMVRMGNRLQQAGRRAALGLTLPLLGAATVAVKSSLTVIDAQAKMAQSMGTSVRSMQVLDRAADLSGVAMGEVSQATIQLTKRLSDVAATGKGPAAEALRTLHLRAQDLQKLPLDERLVTIQDALAQYVPEAERAAVATALFGTRAGITFTRIDSAALRTASRDVERFGVAVSEVDAEQIEVTNDAISRLGLVGRGVGNQLAVGLAQPLENLANKAADAAEWFAGLSGKTKQFIATGTAITAAAGPAAIAIGGLIKGVVALRGAVLLTLGPWGVLAGGIAAVGGAWANSLLAAENYAVAVRGLASAHDTLLAATDAFYSNMSAKNAEAMRRAAEAARDATREALEAAKAELKAASFATNFFGASLWETPRMAEARAAIEELEAALATAEAQLDAAGIAADRTAGNLNAGAQASSSLASGLSVAAGQAATLSSFVSSLPGALAGAEANIAGLKAGIAVLAGGGDQAAANIAKYRAELEASLPPMEDIKEEQRDLVREGIEQKVALYAEEQKLSGEYQKQLGAINKLKSAGGAAAKGALAQLLQEIRQRKTLVGLTGQQRREFEALLQVQQRLGKEAAGLSDEQIRSLSGQLAGIEELEGALQRVEDLQKQWSEQITRTAFEGGNLGDTIKGMLKDIAFQLAHAKIVLPIVAEVTGFLGLDRLSLQTGANGGSGGASGGSGILGGLLGSGGLLGGLSSGVGIGLSNLFTGGIGSYFGGIGAQAGMVFANGFSASALGGLMGMAAPLAIVGAVLAKGLSQKYAGSGIRGAFDASGFEGSSIDFYKGGFLRKNRTDYKDVDENLEAMMDGAMRGVVASIEGYAGVLDLNARKIRKITGAEFTLWTNGKSEAEIQQALNSEITSVANEMAALVLGTEKFTRVGESALETLDRLGTGLGAVNDVADLLGHRALAVSLAGADAASMLVDLFGGTEAMATAAAGYFEAFHSDAEQNETALRRLRAQFAALNVAMPQSRAGFRALVEGIDLGGAAGRKLYAGLLSLSGAMDAVLPQLANLSLGVTGLVERIGGAMADRIETARDMAADARAAAELWYKTAQSLRDFREGLPEAGLSGASEAQAGELRRNRFETALDLARGGDVQAAQDIPALARSYLQAAQAGASSSLEYRRIAAQVQGQVQFIAGLSDLQGANQDVLQGLYERQIEVLTSLGNFLQLEGMTDSEVSRLSQGVQDLAADWDGTVAAFETSLKGLETAIAEAEAFSYDDLVGQLDVAVSLSGTAPAWLRKLVGAAEGGLRTTLDFIIRRDDLTPDLRWIAVQGLKDQVQTLDFVVRKDLTKRQAKIALKTDDALRRDIRMVVVKDIPEEAKRLALAEDSRLSRRVNITLTKAGDTAIRRLNRLRDMIGGTGDGKITFDGGISFSPAEAFETLFADSADKVAGLRKPLSGLTGMLDKLRAAVRDDIADRKAQGRIAALNIKGADLKVDVNGRKSSAASLVDQVRALEASTGAQLARAGGKDAILKQNKDGTIAYQADWISGSAEAVTAFRAAFHGPGGLEQQIFAINKAIRAIPGDRAALKGLRQQVIGLGGIPGFAGGGAHMGGWRVVGERGWELENTGPSRVVSHSDTMAMLDNRQVVERLDGLARQAAVQGQKLELFVRKIAQLVEGWNDDGLPEVRI
ncbi:hypothetical protein [Antarcticimicrobium luteum]|uniref:Uncharacterized protein n=1 Tax=Antarcticimicrobium luteum TaxID=2547397 RepID=A0A4R5VF65_9RHOB|nr:hypothetical protein [Antarcticimicrobium luteum]TDK51135.1 hypothetical protein E1832_03965 [Antarcticimicrobium luteum]